MKTSMIALPLLVSLLGSLPVRSEDAATYPSRKIRMLLPFAAGGGGDVLGRILADRMGFKLGQIIFIENRTGAAGTIGTQQVALAPPDGYTITIGGMTTHVLAAAIYPKLPYDPIKDFTTIGRIGKSSILLVATPDFPANDIKQLKTLSEKGQPIQYGTWGIGSTGQFCAEILSQQTGIKLEHLPFNGAPKLANDLLGHHISVGMLDMVTGTPLVKDGQVKALAVCGDRSPSLPEVASFQDQGVAFDRSLAWVMYAPANLPGQIAQKLSDALQASLEDSDIKSKILALGVTADFKPGDEQREINVKDIAAWKKVAKDAKIEVK